MDAVIFFTVFGIALFLFLAGYYLGLHTFKEKFWDYKVCFYKDELRDEMRVELVGELDYYHGALERVAL